MKTCRRLLALTLVLALALSLTGCGSFTSRMTRAARKMSKLQSYSMDLNMDMAMKMSVLGQDMDMDMLVTGVTDVNTEPSRTRSKLTLGMLGEEMTVLSYSEKTDSGLVSYSSSDDGKSWSKRPLDSEGQAQTTGRNSFTDLLKLAAGFEKTGSETVRGSEATVYAGVLRAEDMENVMQMSDLLKQVLTAMNLPADSVDMKELGSVPVTVALDDKSGMVVKYTMDLTELMGKLMPGMVDALLNEAAAQSGLGGMDLSKLGFKVTTGRVFAETELYNFDAVGTIEIPAEALAAPEAKAA